MDPIKWLELGTRYLSGYVEQFVGVIARPAKFFSLPRRVLIDGTEENSDGASASLSLSPIALDSSFWVFTLFSIVIGFTLQALFFTTNAVDLTTKIMINVAVWFTFGVYAHLLCISVFRGSASFTTSAAVAVRVIAVAYVASSVVSLLIWFYLKGFGLTESPELEFVYIGVQALIIGICGTAGLATVHNIRRFMRLLLVLALPVPVAFFNFLVLLRSVESVGGPK
jgi:hypothetical protein